jgi:hypothetical protein
MRTRIIRHHQNTPPVVGEFGLPTRPFPVQAKARQSPSPEKDAREIKQQPQSTPSPGASFSRVQVSGDRWQPGHPGSGLPLPEAVRKKMEIAFRADFSDVRIHQGPDAESLSALAFTQARDIHFAPGHYNPSSREGQRIIAHELTHVMQQRAGKVAVPEGQDVALNSDPTLEAEADALGSRAAEGEPVNVPSIRPGGESPTYRAVGGPIQGMQEPMDNGGGRGGRKKKSRDEEEENEPPTSVSRFPNYGTFSAPPPSVPTSYHSDLPVEEDVSAIESPSPSPSPQFSEAEQRALQAMEFGRRVGKVTEYTGSNPLKSETYSQLRPSVKQREYEETQPLLPESDELQKWRVRDLGKETGKLVLGKAVDKLSGLPVSGSVDTLSTASTAVQVGHTLPRGGYEEIPDAPEIENANAVISRRLKKQGTSKATSVGGGLLGATIGSLFGPVGTFLGGFFGGKAASKATDKVLGTENEDSNAHAAVLTLHQRAREGDGSAFATLLSLGIDEDTIKASDGWKAAMDQLGLSGHHLV